MFHSPSFAALITDARKRHKKDHDKARKGKERRASGEHRRSKGPNSARRGSANCWRDWSPDGSSEGSPPPSLSEGDVDVFLSAVIQIIAEATDQSSPWISDVLLPVISL